MGFTYSAIGSNTPENREHLEMLGWKEKYIQDDADIIVCAYNTGMFSAIAKETQDWFKEYKSECIECTGNPALFRAVTAMREDSDIDQYFVADANIMYHLAFPDGEPFFGEIEKGEFFLMDKAMIHADMMGEERFIQDLSHKATIEELQEHFK